ncbi:MAG: HxlR family transcriptional regulator [Marmoricola sp.]|nr:HxlR family transcriptional regulator [Marmoricola sp.]
MVDDTGVRECSIARTLDVVGEKWSLLAVRELMLGSGRFEEIVRRTGAPRDILTTRLRKLEQHGLVERVQYQTRPDRYEYRLTEDGWSLGEIVTMLRDWGDEHLAGPEGPPVLFRHSCGEIYRPVLTCEACGEQADVKDLTLVES